MSEPAFNVLVLEDPGSLMLISSLNLFLMMNRGAMVTTLVNLYLPSPSATESPT